MPHFVQALSNELFDFDRPATRGDRIHFRMLELFILAYTVWYCWDWGMYMQESMTSVLLPLGLAQYVDVSFMFTHYLGPVNAVLVAVLSAIGFFRLWRPSYFLALLFFHLQYVSRYSLGEISHGSNLIGMGILGLGLALIVFRSEFRRQRFALGFLYFFIGLGYTSAAFCKLIGTGITWPDGHHLLMWIAERKVDTIAKFGTFEPRLLQELVLQDVRFGTLFLMVGLMTEFASFLMWWRKYRNVVILLVAGMHIGIVLTMDIFFQASTYLLLLLGIPWNHVIDYALKRLPALSSPSLSPSSSDSA
jgi:hypothetical protein